MLYHGDFISQRIKIIVHFKQKNTPAVKRGLHKAQSNRNCIRNIIQMTVKLLFHLESFKNIIIDNFIVMIDNHTVADPLFKQFDGMVAHLAGQHTFPRRRRAAALHMAKHCSARLNARARLNLLSDVMHRADAADTGYTLGHNDDKMLLAGAQGALHFFDDCINRERNLRHQDCNRAACDTGMKRDVAATAPHHLDD